MDHEDDFTGALVIDKQVQLRAELIWLEDFQLTGDLAWTRWQFGQRNVGALRTEAAIDPSAWD
jgi:hypothetical protein